MARPAAWSFRHRHGRRVWLLKFKLRVRVRIIIITPAKTQGHHDGGPGRIGMDRAQAGVRVLAAGSG